MGVFDAAGAAAVQGLTVTPAVLAFFDFASAPKRIHTGYGPILAGGYEWQGVGGLVQIGDIETAVGGVAPLVTFTLSGVADGSITDFLNAPTEIHGRICQVYVQFYGPDLAPLGLPCTVLRNRMSRLIHRAGDTNTWSLELETEGLFSRRGLPPFGNLTDRDQQRRYPGDRGLFNVQAMLNRRRPWNPTIPD